MSVEIQPTLLKLKNIINLNFTSVFIVNLVILHSNSQKKYKNEPIKLSRNQLPS